MNDMINHAKSSQFQLPAVFIPWIAFGLNLIGDMIGGTLAMSVCNRFQPSAVATNRILLLSVAVNGLLVVLWVKFIECRNICDIGLDKHLFGKGSAIGAVTGFGSFVSILVIGYTMHAVTYQSADYSLANVMSVILMLPFWMVQAGAEEIIIRGWVLPEVSAGSNRRVGILVSSALFVVFHLNNAGLNAMAVINIFLIGVLLAVYTLESGSLWGAVMFHTFWNFTQGSVFGLSVSGSSFAKPHLVNFVTQGSSLLSGGSFGIEASVMTTAVIVLLLTILLLYPQPTSR